MTATVTRCRWDRVQEIYLRDGQPCTTDDYGDLTHHCTARRSCGNHIGPGEATCARCVGRARSTVRRIVEIAPLALTRALDAGVNSDAASIAGPAADYRIFSARRTLDRLWILCHIPDTHLERALTNLLPDDDTQHPYSVTTRWHLMLAEDYGQQLPDVMTITDSGAYLDRTLHRMAQDPSQDFSLFAREMLACLTHIEAVIQNSMKPEHGAPCPDCTDAGRLVRMHREYPHYCDDPDCERFHYDQLTDHETGELVPDTTADVWVCPVDREHTRSHEDYTRWVEERRHGAQAGAHDNQVSAG